MNIKSKLCQQDIEQVLKILNGSGNTKSQHFNKENMIINNNQGVNYDIGMNGFDNINNLSNTSICSDNNDMDTTLVTDN